MAMGAFATTLLTVSLAMMGFRGVSIQTLFVGNLCLVAGIGMFISAQWELVKGNTFAYTVLSAFGTSTFRLQNSGGIIDPERATLQNYLLMSFEGLFYAAYGFVMSPGLGITDSYGGLTPEYHNAFGFFILSRPMLPSTCEPQVSDMCSLGRDGRLLHHRFSTIQHRLYPNLHYS